MKKIFIIIVARHNSYQILIGATDSCRLLTSMYHRHGDGGNPVHVYHDVPLSKSPPEDVDDFYTALKETGFLYASIPPTSVLLLTLNKL